MICLGDVMKVLMLGWEFPPLINGGLGIACLGLGRALAQRVELSFIVPKIDPQFVVDKLELMGLNHLGDLKLDYAKIENRLAAFREVTWVDGAVAGGLLPYGDSYLFRAPRVQEVEAKEASWQTITSESRKKVLQSSTGENLELRLKMFREGVLYGEDVGERVWTYAQVVAAIAEDKEFDVVHAHDWMTFVAGMEVKRRCGKPLVLHVHSLNYDRGGPDSRGWVYDIEKEAMEMADLVIPVSRYTGSICINHYGIDANKVRFVHNGADPVETFRSKSPFRDGLVLFLGLSLIHI